MIAKFISDKQLTSETWKSEEHRTTRKHFSLFAEEWGKVRHSVRVYDTTLRDGNQAVGVNFSVDDKLKIARRLSDFGIHYIESGWPNPTNPSELEVFSRLREERLHSKIVAFGMTRKPDLSCQKDENLNALRSSNADCIAIVGKAWLFHVERVLETTADQNLKMISDSIAYLKDHGYDIIFDAEHFFDGFKDNPEFAMRTVSTAAQAGAQDIVLCDTRGGAMPNEVYEITAFVKEKIDKPLGIHAHNDRGLATANSLFAVMGGAEQVQGTINGIGERCGNADLVEVISNLELSLGVETGLDLSKLTRLSDYIYEIANLSRDHYQPFVGEHAFAHKAGIHGHAVNKFPETYEHANPSLFGNTRSIVVSSQTGMANIISKAKEFGLNLERDSAKAAEIMLKIKELEAAGYHLENAEATVNLVYARSFGERLKYFDLIDWKALVLSDSDGATCESTVKVKINEKPFIITAEGNGPVNAFDSALKKALENQYPELAKVRLVGYRVREIDAEKGTAAAVRVFIEFEADGKRWSTVGVSTNILKASEEALLDGYIYFLYKGNIIC